MGELKSNFSTKQAYEDDDFISEKSGSKLEAIPEDAKYSRGRESLTKC